MDDRGVAKHAAAQRGLITWDQALRLDLTPEAIRQRLDLGRWERLHVGVFRIAGNAESYEQALQAACLAIGAVTASSHRAAATLHGLLSFRNPTVEVTTTRSRSPELRGGVIVHRLADLEPRWIEHVDGIPCTSVARTLVDLGAVCAPQTIDAALDRAIGKKLVTLPEVRTALRAVARKGRRGVGTIRSALDARDDVVAAGVLEARMMTLLRRSGLQVPIPEYEIRDEAGRFVARVDFAYPEIKLAIEVDGYEPHVAARAFRNDRSRQNKLMSIGWSVLRFTWAQVDSHDEQVTATIERELRRLAI